MTKGYIIQLFNGRVGNRSNYFSWGTGKDQSVLLPKPMAEGNRTLWSFPIQMYQGKNCFSILYSPKKEMQHVKKYNLLQIFNIILNTKISITLTAIWHTGCSDFKVN
jgi:hypothetical protein